AEAGGVAGLAAAAGRGTAPESTSPFVSNSNGANRQLAEMAMEAAGLVFDLLQNVASIPPPRHQTNPSSEHKRRRLQRHSQLHPLAKQRNLHLLLRPPPNEPKRRDRNVQLVLPAPQIRARPLHPGRVQDVPGRSDLLLRQHREHPRSGQPSSPTSSGARTSRHPPPQAATNREWRCEDAVRLRADGSCGGSSRIFRLVGSARASSAHFNSCFPRSLLDLLCPPSATLRKIAYSAFRCVLDVDASSRPLASPPADLVVDVRVQHRVVVHERLLAQQIARASAAVLCDQELRDGRPDIHCGPTVPRGSPGCFRAGLGLPRSWRRDRQRAAVASRTGTPRPTESSPGQGLRTRSRLAGCASCIAAYDWKATLPTIADAADTQRLVAEPTTPKTATGEKRDDAAAAAAAAPEQPGDDPRAPLERFRQRKPLSVTDLVSPACDEAGELGAQSARGASPQGDKRGYVRPEDLECHSRAKDVESDGHDEGDGSLGSGEWRSGERNHRRDQHCLPRRRGRGSNVGEGRREEDRREKEQATGSRAEDSQWLPFRLAERSDPGGTLQKHALFEPLRGSSHLLPFRHQDPPVQVFATRRQPIQAR
ncbi:9048_t:CDS:10, partial [Scutellospora calospora]